jgi:Outer membrane lipoprotein-sorting protein
MEVPVKRSIQALLSPMLLVGGLAVALTVTAPLWLPAIPAAWAAPALDEMVKMLQVVDDRQMNNGDYKALFYIQQKSAGKADLIYQGVVYRRDEADKLVILFLKPQSESGKGYLRVDANLFMYDPTVGKWERRTERERIGGTGSPRSFYLLTSQRKNSATTSSIT